MLIIFFLDTTDVYDLISATDPEISSTRSESSLSDTSSQQWLLHSQNLIHFDPDLGDSRDFSQIFPGATMSTATTSLDSLNSMQSIFELDDNSNVVLKGRIGQGFYGDVFRGTLEDLSDDASEPVIVAVKKLKSFAVSSCVQDFEREISIMKVQINYLQSNIIIHNYISDFETFKYRGDSGGLEGTGSLVGDGVCAAWIFAELSEDKQGKTAYQTVAEVCC